MVLKHQAAAGVLMVLLAGCGRPHASAEGGAGAAAASGNWALGSWTEVDPSCGSVLKEVYGPTTYRNFDGAQWSEHRVSYNLSREEIWMHVDGGGTWTVVRPVDANHIREDFGKSCVYVRTG